MALQEMLADLAKDNGLYETPPDEGSGETGEFKPPTLSDRFGVPPFSVLDARQGYWQDRKRAWLAIGIKSELGRGGDLMSLEGAPNRQKQYANGGGRMQPPADQ